MKSALARATSLVERWSWRRIRVFVFSAVESGFTSFASCKDVRDANPIRWFAFQDAPGGVGLLGFGLGE